MASKLTESRLDHRGGALPEGVYALVNAAGDVVSYKARWREADATGVVRQRSRSFAPGRHGSLPAARAAAVAHRRGALEVVGAGDTVLRAAPAPRLTLG